MADEAAKETNDGSPLGDEKPAAFYLCIAFFCCCLSQGLAWGTGYSGVYYYGAPLVVWCSAVAMVIQWIAFVPAAIYQTEKYYDITGSFTYLTMVAMSLCGGAFVPVARTDANPSSGFQPRQIVASSMAVIWAVRLGSFLLIRVFKDGKDGRFNQIKLNPPRFFNAWCIQGVWVFFTIVPVVVINSNPTEKPIDVACWIGWSIWLVAFLLEAIADQQKSWFAARKTGKWIDEGLWHYSRHPNYLGEILMWVGIVISGATLFKEGEWAVVISPLFVTFLLMKVSGVPMVEKRSDEKWGDDPEYQRYKQETPVLLLKPKFDRCCGKAGSADGSPRNGPLLSPTGSAKDSGVGHV